MVCWSILLRGYMAKELGAVHVRLHVERNLTCQRKVSPVASTPYTNGYRQFLVYTLVMGLRKKRICITESFITIIIPTFAYAVKFLNRILVRTLRTLTMESVNNNYLIP